MREIVGKIVMLNWMRWLGHIARMPKHRIPKQILFPWSEDEVGRQGSERHDISECWVHMVLQDTRQKEVV